MKKIEEIQKNVPEITVQVKYDILEKATEQAKEKLKELLSIPRQSESIHILQMFFLYSNKTKCTCKPLACMVK